MENCEKYTAPIPIAPVSEKINYDGWVNTMEALIDFAQKNSNYIRENFGIYVSDIVTITRFGKAVLSANKL